VPRTDRGLLSKGPQKNPGPHDYKPPETSKFKARSSNFKMPKASRDIHFAKYSSIHNELVKKGIC